MPNSSSRLSGVMILTTYSSQRFRYHATVQWPGLVHVRFSNRPVWVKRFQTIHQCCVDVAHGRALLFGIGTKALPSWGSRTRGPILGAALPLRSGRSKRTYDLTSSIVPRGT